MLGNYSADSRCELNVSEFKEMINSIDEGKNICDKDIILGLYYTLYMMMIPSIEVINENVAKEYRELFNKTMNTVIRLSKSRKDMVSVKSFIGNFLYYLNSNELSQVSPISDMLDLFKNDLDTFINVDRNICNNFLLVDKEFTLEEKVAISIQYKNYISDLYINMTSIYGVTATKDILDDLKNTLDLVFPDALSISDGMDRFDGEIRSYTKDRLKEFMLTNKFDFYSENNDFAYNLIQMLNDDEIKVFKLYYLYKLALFDGEHFITMEVNDESIALELGMDRDLFKKAFNGIARKSKIMHLKQSLKIRKRSK